MFGNARKSVYFESPAQQFSQHSSCPTDSSDVIGVSGKPSARWEINALTCPFNLGFPSKGRAEPLSADF
jgi:hypothetical protein